MKLSEPPVMTRLGRTCSSDINSLYEYVGAYLESFLLIELTASVALCCWHGTLRHRIALKLLTHGRYFVFIYLRERRGQPLKVRTPGSFETSENQPMTQRHISECWILKVVAYFEGRTDGGDVRKPSDAGNVSTNVTIEPHCLTL